MKEIKKLENGYQTIGTIIQHFKGKNIVIPSYQRGYRWEEKQVKELLNDMFEYVDCQDENDIPNYCIQPLVVAEKIKDGFTIINVIDGQQRLTTISMILETLSDDNDIQIELKYKSKSEDGNTIDKVYRKNAKIFV